MSPATTEEELNALRKAEIPPNPYHCPTAGPSKASPSSFSSSSSSTGLQSPKNPSAKQQQSSQSVVSDPDSALGSDFTDGGGCTRNTRKPPQKGLQTALGGPWVGTLILGPGMDDVMCAEEMEYTQFHQPSPTPMHRHTQADRKVSRLFSLFCARSSTIS